MGVEMMSSLIAKTMLLASLTMAVVMVDRADSTSLGELMNGAKDNMSSWIENEILRKSPIVVMFSDTMDKIKKRFDEVKLSKEMVDESEHELSIVYYKLVIDELHKLLQELRAKNPFFEEKKNEVVGHTRRFIGEVVRHELEIVVRHILIHFASGGTSGDGLMGTVLAAANVSIKFGLAQFLMDKVKEMSGGLTMPTMTQIREFPQHLQRSLSQLLPKLPSLPMMESKKLERSMSDVHSNDVSDIQ